MSVLTFSVQGKPPIKNEALSLLSVRHGQIDRVVSLLTAARDAMAAGGLTHGFGGRLLALEVVVRSRTMPPSGDATNFLGGIGDVLQDKHRRRELGHLGDLAAVSVFNDDKQVVRLVYEAIQADTECYTVTIRAH